MSDFIHDLEWHKEHKRLGFYDPIAELFEDMEKAQLSEEDATFNESQHTQRVESVEDYVLRRDAIDALHNGTCSECVYTCDEPYSRKCGAIDRYSAGIHIIEELPAADVVNRSQLIETIKHYAQYPDGIHKLLAVYAERRTDG